MKILICIQDEKYVEYLIHKIQTLPCDEELSFESYTETPGLVQHIERDGSGEYDIAFLGDVIQGRNGFDLGRLIKENNENCIIIYVCDDYKYMHEGFRAYAFQMMLKSQEKLLESEFQRAFALYKKIHFQVIFHVDSAHDLKFAPHEIEYIESNHELTTVVTAQNRYQGFFDDIKWIKKQLVNYHFFQMHPQYFVNMEHIELIKSGELRLDNGDSIPTSAMNKEVIDDAIQTFVDHY